MGGSALRPCGFVLGGADALTWYCEKVKNITVSLDDETYRRARIKAAEMDTSVSALVKQFLTDLGAGESEFERLKKMELALRERVAVFRASDRRPREATHEPRR
jgi:hypothetical protein